eukprot:maker-scaffold_5-snap-gene-10.67-mRNA-1 protein AED:0.03 eAED:0.03 QI:62/1/1/1/0.33/0.5/4/925/127
MNSAEEQIRELQQQLGNKEITKESMAELEEKKKAEQEMLARVLKQVCSVEAYDRLQTVKTVKPELVGKLERQLFNAAKSGKIGARLTEQQVKEMLSGLGASTKKVVRIQRKKGFDEDDSDDNDDDLM